MTKGHHSPCNPLRNASRLGTIQKSEQKTAAERCRSLSALFRSESNRRQRYHLRHLLTRSPPQSFHRQWKRTGKSTRVDDKLRKTFRENCCRRRMKTNPLADNCHPVPSNVRGFLPAFHFVLRRSACMSAELRLRQHFLRNAVYVTAWCRPNGASGL